MDFQIDPIELVRVLRQLKLNSRANGKHIWFEADKYNEVIFSGTKDFIKVKTQVIGSGRIRVNSVELARLKDSLKLTDEKVEFITEDPYLVIKQGSFVFKFNYLTEWLNEQRKQIIKESKQTAKEWNKVNQQLKVYGKIV